jgi:hypothetical protein
MLSWSWKIFSESCTMTPHFKESYAILREIWEEVLGESASSPEANSEYRQLLELS